MPAHASPQTMTAEQLLDVEVPGKWIELVRGQLVVREPPSTYHGMISWRLSQIIGEFVRDQGLGALFGQDTGFRIESDPDTVRAPDVAFVAAARLPLIPRRGYATLAPDLVAEVVSESDRPGELLARIGAWLDAGVQLVWVVDPQRGEARVHRADGSMSVIGIDATLDGEHVLPGFRCSLRSVLDAG